MLFIYVYIYIYVYTILHYNIQRYSIFTIRIKSSLNLPWLSSQGRNLFYYNLNGVIIFNDSLIRK